MAGYIFSISKDNWTNFVEQNLRYGYFTPYCLEINEDMTDRKKIANNKVLMAVFGDMVTMKPGDNIYFLSSRKLYGIGIAKQIGDDCKYDNYIGASSLIHDHNVELDDEIFLTTRSNRAKWVCLFVPHEHFFIKGVDMDDVLRFRPSSFRMLRAFEGLSFIKIDDEENRALREYICLKNEAAYDDIDNNVFQFDTSVHNKLSSMDLTKYKMDLSKAMNDKDNFKYIESEMFIESILLQHLSERRDTPFGEWEYVTHQLIASPFKPLKYIDKIDIFGYKFSSHYKDSPKLITKYLIIELKKDKINKAALEQAMQYVDWICMEYASGDYSIIEAYVLGNGTVRNINKVKEEICQRTFILSSHPATPEKWNDFHIINYTISDTVRFEEICDETP